MANIFCCLKYIQALPDKETNHIRFHKQTVVTLQTSQGKYFCYILIVKRLAVIAKMRKKETNEQTKSSEEVIDECRNPYLKFLNNLVDDETPELISSLQSWLGFAGSMTGAGGNIITKSKKKTPWKKEEEKKLDETMAKKAEATMHKISSER